MVIGLYDNVSFKTRIRIFNKTKNRLEKEYENIVTMLGRELYADRIINDNVPVIDFLGIGNGVGSHTSTSTALFNETFRKQIENKTSPGNSASFDVTILGYEAVGLWTELGLFNQSISGILTNVSDINYNHLVGDEIAIEWLIIFN